MYVIIYNMLYLITIQYITIMIVALNFDFVGFLHS